MKTKYAILVGDGMADFPVAELDGKTPLEYAQTPGMDAVAFGGTIGRALTIPAGCSPGSDVANLSLMGYDPARFYSGRAPIEAASMGIKLSPTDTAFRCNLVTIASGRMADYSAGHIETGKAREIIMLLKSRLDSASVRFYPGVSYRHLLVIRDFPSGCVCTPPHDISGQDTAAHLPRGPGSDMLRELMDKARGVLHDAPENNDRKARGVPEATDIWLWGQGRAITLPTLRERYGLSGSVISAVDLIRGLGVLAGMRVRLVKGATGYLGTDYAGKVAAARSALAGEDFVFLHVEAPDETSHEGDLNKKIQAIEEFDKHIVREMLNFQKQTPALRLLVAPDHATPLSLKTHHAAPVPYAACGPGIRSEKNPSYCERAARERPAYTGPDLFDRFIRGALQ
ncbi:MAG: cofactor-independent phosphoglycerate mutase [Chitinispirillaceae bacterium]|nr:cofactor-independent phosphoglycerate mutase [Chitinispirillaceae bacterium]